MAFDWEQYIDLADELIEGHQVSEHPEACLRAAVSRAYYGVFILARDWYFRRTGIPADSRPAHTAVVGWYMRDRTTREFGKKLESLMNQRHEADYNAQGVIEAGEVDTACASARRLCREMKNRLNPTRH